ncbi:helix-turn-helix domain-containing protein [Kribbella kalugense]|uniref:Transcriptional regulator with XRE-family HTH domain n=1 Tax=Kribbella kalugense TaxID=2512221 RepID=A0A4R7ZS04_9ACTN|nr:helix-turn-helix transcriptional regulator [Kribbella kalugense]TDW19448.1 transcriptional regulator with XRE-family HTH domain [Kribbella kalugense]
MTPSHQDSDRAIVTQLGNETDTSELDAASIGQRITSLRTDKGLSLGELAAQATVSKSYLSTVEKGSGSRPGATILHKIAQALGVTLADLVGRQVLADPLVIPDELRALALERKLPMRDIEMLAGIAFRGEAPRTKERWAFIYDAIKNSAGMDASRR